MNRVQRGLRWGSALGALGFLAVIHAGCGAEIGAAEDTDEGEAAWAGDCDWSDQAGALADKARSGQMFDARLSYRQTNDAGQGITAACDLGRHAVTDQGMRDVPLHCSGRSQAQSGYARVGARWGTSYGAESCTTDYCAAIYIQDSSGAVREVVRDIYLKDRFFCTQSSDRDDERLDVDACTYADVIGALKGTGASADDSNLTFDGNWKLAGYDAKGYRLKYKMYACGAGPGGGGGSSGGGCSDTPPDGRFSCADQASWGKCNEAWMQGFCNASCGRCSGGGGGGACSDTPPDGRFSCADQASWGKCNEPWMTSGDFCRRSCGRC